MNLNQFKNFCVISWSPTDIFSYRKSLQPFKKKSTIYYFLKYLNLIYSRHPLQYIQLERILIAFKIKNYELETIQQITAHLIMLNGTLKTLNNPFIFNRKQLSLIQSHSNPRLYHTILFRRESVRLKRSNNSYVKKFETTEQL